MLKASGRPAFGPNIGLLVAGLPGRYPHARLDHYDEAVPLLEAPGYQAWLQWLNWGSFAVGIRR